MSKNLLLPFDLDAAKNIADRFGTPVYIYDEEGIRATAQGLNEAFAWANDYRNYFAVKATPTPAILALLHKQGMGFDCSSRAELLMMQRMGISGQEIFFTSNNTPKEDFELAISLGATINIDDLTQVPVFLEVLGDGALARVAARYNPGNLKSGNTIIGTPTEAKYGMDIEQLKQAFKMLSKATIGSFGLHAMVASGVLDASYFVDTAELLLDAINQIEQSNDVEFDFVNLGGGLGVNYKADQEILNIKKVSEGVREVISKSSKSNLKLYTENGRYVTGPHGYLLTRVRYVMHKYKTYAGVDASMHNLMRPGMYGAYHHITILGKETNKSNHVYDVSGSLCENNDKFAIDRNLPELKAGDLMMIHDVGAHGHAMGFNYNGLLRSAELLLKSSGKVELIRRAETTDDYFKTVVWPERVTL